MTLFESAFAQSASSPQQPNPLVSFLPFILIFIIFYFLMIRPQKRKMQQEKALLASLSKGDEVYTKSGIFGTIVGMTERIITLEISEGTKLKILREQIGGLAKGLWENKASGQRQTS